MSVDINKIRPGDTVHVAMVVKEMGFLGDNFIAESPPPIRVAIAYSNIISHIPKPKEWKVGDLATWGPGHFYYPIIAIHNNIAWMGGDNTILVKELMEPQSHTRDGLR